MLPLRLQRSSVAIMRPRRLAQRLALKPLEALRVNMDASFVVPLQQISGERRDSRPLNLIGRIAVLSVCYVDNVLSVFECGRGDLN